PAPACRRRAVCWRPSRSGATLPPTVPTTGCSRLPNRPWLSAPVPPLVARRSPIADTAADDRSILTPAHAPADLVRPARARSGDSALVLAQCSRTSCSSASGAHAESLGNWRARTPTLLRHLRSAFAARLGIADTRFLSARAGGFRATDAPAEPGVWASPQL